MKKWTIMFYLAGDNNLSEDMISSMRGIQKVMRTAGSDDEINLITIYDSSYPTAPITAYHITHENSSKKLQDCVFQRTLSATQIREEQEDDTPRIMTFVEIIASNADFRAENYALVMSGHSDAFLGKTMFRDDDSKKELNLSYLGNILNRAADFLPAPHKFSVVCFDSCMMGTLEVGCELSDSTDIMVASQGFAPTYGWDYEEVLKELVAQKGNMTPVDFANSIAKHQIDSSQHFSIGGRSMNLSVVDLNKADDLADSLDALGKIFNDIITAKIDDSIPKTEAESNALIAECVKNIIHNSHYHSQTFLHEQTIDILDFVASLSSNCEMKRKELELLIGTIAADSVAGKLTKKLEAIQTQCEFVKKKVGDYVKANHASGADYQFSEGVSVFFPWTRLALNMVYKRYEKLEFGLNKAKNWLEFIENYTVLTFRSNGTRRFESSTDFVGFQGEIITMNRASTGKDTELTRASTGKASTGKAETALFYKLFSRFRNHPISHDFVK